MAPVFDSTMNDTKSPRKRRKVSKTSSANVGSNISLDQLAWREIPFPEKYADAEGFFGLEEISDVEIDRSDGKLGYKLAAVQSAQGKLKAGNGKLKAASSSGSENDDEWSGFDDEPSTRNGHTTKMSSKSDKSGPNKSIGKPPVNGTEGEDFNVLQDIETSAIDVQEWQHLNLSDPVLTSLSQLSFSKPTPIQQAAIPEIMQGHDLIGKAPTGSGKTLAFAIPILERFLENQNVMSAQTKTSDAIALIISPTRELAHQLSSHVERLCSMPDAPVVATVTGGLSAHKQQRVIAKAQILIGTPGRLWELISSRPDVQKKLEKIEFLVLDEADRLLSEGHFQELSEILKVLERTEVESEANDWTDRQTLVFSATFQKDLQRKLSGKGKLLSKELLDQKDSMEYLLKRVNFRESKPKFVDVNPDQQMAENLTERILECEALEKDLYLYALLLHKLHLRTLVFTNSISSVRRLVPFLQTLNIHAHALHSSMPQKARLRSIERFSSSPANPKSSSASSASVLIATDVAARGLDIPSVDLILHYHVPHAADAYVHRSGRTARAERSGASILLCSPDEFQGVRRLVAKVHAQSSNRSGAKGLSTIELNPAVVARLKTRVMLSKKITDAVLAKEKGSAEENWWRNAAEELGVDVEDGGDGEFGSGGGKQKGRGSGRKKREEAARQVGKDELAAWRAQLRERLRERVNVGVSERYLTAGGLDVEALLQEQEKGTFLGKMDIDGF